MPVIVDDIMEFKAVSACRDQAGINVIHYKCTAIAGGGVEVPDVLSNIATLLGTLIKACLSSEAAYVRMEGKLVRPVLGNQFDNVTWAGAGMGGAPVLPLQVSGILTKQSAFAGRRFRGRMYVPFPSEVDNGALGIPSVGYLQQLAALATAMAQVRVVTVGAVSSTMTPIIFRRTAAADSRTIINVRVNPKFATQRTRGSYGRPN